MIGGDSSENDYCLHLQLGRRNGLPGTSALGGCRVWLSESVWGVPECVFPLSLKTVVEEEFPDFSQILLLSRFDIPVSIPHQRHASRKTKEPARSVSHEEVQGEVLVLGAGHNGVLGEILDACARETTRAHTRIE